eukprot:663211_1
MSKKNRLMKCRILQLSHFSAPSIPSICNLCDLKEDEDLNHYVMKCKAFKSQRRELKQNLEAIYHRFVFNRVFTLENIVYPYKIRKLPRPKQHKIWKALIDFIRKTKRLKHKLINTSDHELIQPQQPQQNNTHRINNQLNDISHPWNPG